MSLSQKHAGLILVPWFNTDEWRFVHKLVYSDDLNDRKKALNILKIWEIRTPLLSAGVKGTIILLEALINIKNDISNEQLNNLYAVALLRFLNLCAANNEKQGTFYKTASKNDLPKWLINLRHDIAHGNHLPSLSLLKIALEHCFKWLQTKYWQQQQEITKDHLIEEQTENYVLNDMLTAYIRLNICSTKNECFNRADLDFIEDISGFIYKKFHQKHTDLNTMLGILEEMFKHGLDENKNLGESLASVFVQNGLLTEMYEVNPEGKAIIPLKFREVWSNIINIFHEKNVLFCILDTLYDVTGHLTANESTRKLAALWICEIMFSLLILRMIKEEIDAVKEKSNKKDVDEENIKKNIKNRLEQNPQFEKHVDLDSVRCLYRDEAKQFETKVLNYPNEFVFHFLEVLLKFNNSSENFTKDTLGLLRRVLRTTQNSYENTEKIFTLENVNWTDENEDVSDVMDVDLKESGAEYAKSKQFSVGNYLASSGNNQKSRWRKIEDVSAFKGCPLGVLPHQNRNESPVVKYFKQI